MRKFLVLLFVLSVAGCAGPDELAREWYGREIGEVVLKLGIPDRIIALPDQGNEVSYRGSGVRDGAVYQCRLIFTTDAEGIILTSAALPSRSRKVRNRGQSGRNGPVRRRARSLISPATHWFGNGFLDSSELVKLFGYGKNRPH